MSFFLVHSFKSLCSISKRGVERAGPVHQEEVPKLEENQGANVGFVKGWIGLGGSYLVDKDAYKWQNPQGEVLSSI